MDSVSLEGLMVNMPSIASISWLTNFSAALPRNAFGCRAWWPIMVEPMRMAISKGLSYKESVFKHALRNSMIPIATTFGQNITLILTGSFLIETIFDIDGLGLLGINAVFDRDYPVVMGIVFLSSLLLLLGNVISDALVAIVDPRIRFK